MSFAQVLHNMVYYCFHYTAENIRTQTHHQQHPPRTAQGCQPRPQPQSAPFAPWTALAARTTTIDSPGRRTYVSTIYIYMPLCILTLLSLAHFPSKSTSMQNRHVLGIFISQSSMSHAPAGRQQRDVFMNANAKVDPAAPVGSRCMSMVQTNICIVIRNTQYTTTQYQVPFSCLHCEYYGPKFGRFVSGLVAHVCERR